MHRPKILSLLAIVLIAATSCKKNRAESQVTIDMSIIGLATVAGTHVTHDDSAKETIILANQPDHCHKAMLIVNKVDILPGDLNKFQSIGTLDSKEWYALNLDGVQIELNNSDTSGVNFSMWGEDNDKIKPDDFGKLEQVSSLHWVPDICKILGSGQCTKNDEYYKLEPLKDNVLARMPLRGGTLATVMPAPDKVLIWRFRDHKQPDQYSKRKHVMAELHYSFLLTSGATSLPISGRSYAQSPGTVPPLTRLFTVQDGSGAGVIHMYLANIPFEDFTKETDVGYGYADPHFHLHFKMIKEAPPDGYDAVILGGGRLTRIIYCGPVSVQ
jgi:hypothetical protein